MMIDMCESICRLFPTQRVCKHALLLGAAWLAGHRMPAATDVMVRTIRSQHGDDSVHNLFWSSTQQQLSLKEGKRRMPEGIALNLYVSANFSLVGRHCIGALHVPLAGCVQQLLTSGFLTSEWATQSQGESFTNGKHVSLHLTAQVYAVNKRSPSC